MDVDELEALTARSYRVADPSSAAELRRAARFEATGVGDEGRRAAVRGGAFLVAYKLGTLRGDLDEAIALLDRAMAVSPSGGRAANLAAALLERCELDGSVGDHRHAVALLQRSIAEPDLEAARRTARMTVLLGAYVDAAERGFPDADLDDALDLGQQMVVSGEPVGEVMNLLGSALLLAAQRGHPRADPARMVELLDRAVAALPGGHPDRAARLSNLAAALLTRYELTGDDADLRRAVEASRSAYEGFPAGHPSRRLALNNLLNVVVAEYERTGRVAELEEMAPLAAELVEAFPAGHPLLPVALGNAGQLFRLVARALNRPDALDSAVSVHRRALGAPRQDDHGLHGRQASLALALADRYHRDRHPPDLHEAIELGEQSLAATRHAAELAGFAANLGNCYQDRYLLAGRMSDLYRAAVLHRDGLARLPIDHHDRPALLNNAGIVALDLYDRLGDPADLDAAAAHLAEAVESSPDGDPEHASRLVNLATVRHRQAEWGDPIGRLAEAERLVEQARSAATHQTARRAADGELADILRDRWRHTDADTDLERLQQVDQRAETPSTPSELLRRGITRGLTGDRAGAERYLRAALDRGVIDRPAVAISAAQLLADHGLRRLANGDRVGLDLVEQAGAAAERARRSIIGLGEPRRAELSWHRDLAGLGAAWAHARFLVGDLDGAWAAFESSRAVLLGRGLPAAPPPTQCYVAVWTGPVGGGAVVVRPGRPLVPVDLPDLVSTDAEALAQSLGEAALLGRRALGDVLTSAARWISERITGRLTPALRAGETVLLALGGAVALLPIEVGDAGGVPFLVRHPVRRALSHRHAGWAEQAAARPLDAHDVVSIAAPAPSALPPLPAALRESHAFAPAERRLHGSSATPEAVIDALGRADLVHLAVHVSAGAVDPLADHLVLADDRPLFADSLLDAAPIRARAVVLAGCATARTTVAHVDEGVALAGAVHAGGVPSVLASLWPVSDLRTAVLMGEVARRLQRGEAPAAALRGAQLATIGAGRGMVDWAGFLTVGGS